MKLDDGRVVPNFIRQAIEGLPLTIHGEGNQTRSFCYIDDLVEGIYRFVLAEQIHQPVNIGNPVETTVLELGEVINRLTNNKAGLLRKSADRVPTDPERRRPDITRAREWLHWEPKVSLETGLARTIADFKARL